MKFSDLPQPSYKVKYALFGTMFGCLFPLLAIFIESREKMISMGMALEVHHSILFWMIESAPFFLGGMAFLLGSKQDQIKILHDRRLLHHQTRSRRLLEEAEEIGRFGSWEWKIEKDEVWWSSGTYHVFDLSSEFITASQKEFLNIVHPDDVPIVKQAVRESLEHGKDFFCSYRILDSLDNVRWIRTEGKIAFDAEENTRKVLGTVHDITEIIKAQEEALLYKSALDKTAIVAFTDRRGKITYVNELSCEISGYSYDELIGKDHRILNSGKMGKKFFQEMWQTISSGKMWTGEICNRTKDGNLYWVDTTIIPSVDHLKNVTGYVAIRREITERKKMEEDLISSQKAAINATKAKAQFLANMSHEIRTPLNGIIGMTELLMGSMTTREKSDRMQIIQNCGKTLLTLINDVLDFSKLEENRIQLEHEPFNLHAITQEIVQFFSARIHTGTPLLSCQFKSDVPTWILGDRMRLEQVLTNLLDNALKFTSNGFIKVTVSMIQEQGKERLIRYTVEDSGIGMSASTIEKLFRPFTQGDVSTTRRYGGSGLGLAICKGIVEKMGGTIFVESVPGFGSRFHFSLKAEEVEILPNSSFSIPPSPEISEERSPLKILVAEDNKVNCLVAVGLLNKFGYQADTVVNGAEALEAIARTKYDIVFMDCHMPVMDGFTATQTLVRNYPDSIRPHIVAFTASATKEDVELCYASGMDDFLAKPIQPELLLKALQRAIQLKSA